MPVSGSESCLATATGENDSQMAEIERERERERELVPLNCLPSIGMTNIVSQSWLVLMLEC